MTRSTHLVGSWTARLPAMAMDNALERLAPHLHSRRYAPQFLVLRERHGRPDLINTPSPAST
jgi:hypothetical protein